MRFVDEYLLCRRCYEGDDERREPGMWREQGGPCHPLATVTTRIAIELSKRLRSLQVQLLRSPTMSVDG